MLRFEPAAVIQSDLFTSMPAQWRRPGLRSAWADANRNGHPVDSFIEGPAFDRAGNLWLTDIPWGRIFRISPAGEWTLVAEYDGEPNGLAIHRDGRVWITDYRRGLLALDPATGAVSTLLERRHSENFRGVNDLTFALNGDCYFTDQGQTGLHDPSGRVYRWRSDGQLDLLLANVPSPNGLVLAPDERVLYVAATRGNCVWRVPLQADGGVSKVGVFVQLFGPSGPDGLAMSEGGELVLAHASHGGAWIFDRYGEALAFVRGIGGRITTNVAFGGEDRRTLYITDSETGSVLRAQVGVAGRALYSHL